MLYAVVTRCPVFGGKVASFDATKAKAMPGVKHVVQISSGVAVVADNTWNAMQARNALAIQWDEGVHANVNSAGIRKEWEALSQQPGAVGRQDGDTPSALAGAAKKIEAVYEAPYLAHAPMEPLNSVADVRADSCEVWASTQGQSTAHQEAIRITGLRPDKCRSTPNTWAADSDAARAPITSPTPSRSRKRSARPCSSPGRAKTIRSRMPTVPPPTPASAAD